MSTQNQNEDVKNSQARIAIGDLNATADVRGGAKGPKQDKKAQIFTLPDAEVIPQVVEKNRSV